MVSPRTFWVGMIVGLLSLSVGVNLMVLFVFAESPKESLPENWEGRNDQWDQLQAQFTQNRKLGWKLDVVEDEPMGANPTAFRLTLVDKERKAIEGASITLKTSHNAHYAKFQRLTAVEFEPGRYRFEMQVPYQGFWAFQGEVRVPGDSPSDPSTLFTQDWTERLELPAAQ